MTGKLHSKKQARDWQTAERQMERERLACPASLSVVMTSQAGEPPALKHTLPHSPERFSDVFPEC